MVNDLTLNPMFVDTAMGSTAGLAKPIRVKKVYWFDPATLGDNFLIHDGTSATNTLLEGQAEAANGSQNFDFDAPVVWKDFQVSTLASGTIYIYYN